MTLPRAQRPSHQQIRRGLARAAGPEATEATEVAEATGVAGAAPLYAVLAALTLANTADLVLSTVGMRRYGLGVEVNPWYHALVQWGGIPAFVAVKLALSVLEVLAALAIWRVLTPETRGERRVALGLLWLGVGWLVLVDLLLLALNLVP